MTWHRWVIHARVPDYLRLGWLALPTLEGTGHGIYSAHCVWLCSCRMIEPPHQRPSCHACGNEINQITQDSTFEVLSGRRFHADCYNQSGAH